MILCIKAQVKQAFQNDREGGGPGGVAILQICMTSFMNSPLLRMVVSEAKIYCYTLECRNPNVRISARAKIGINAGSVFGMFGFQMFGP